MASDRPVTAAEDDPRAVPRLDFRRATQLYRDYWRHSARWCDYVGSCVICGTRTHAFRDGQNDPRGPLGDHAASPLSAGEYTDDRTGESFPESLPDVPLCFLHANEYETYNAAERIALRRWRKAAPIGA